MFFLLNIIKFYNFIISQLEITLKENINKNAAWEDNTNENGWYMGVVGLDGKPIREDSFPEAKYYGLVSAMKGRNAAIINGNIMDPLLWLDFDEDIPKVEVIARHDTDFMSMTCQYSHPHTIFDPNGRYIVSNSAQRRLFYGPGSDILLSRYKFIENHLMQMVIRI